MSKKDRYWTDRTCPTCSRVATITSYYYAGKDNDHVMKELQCEVGHEWVTYSHEDCEICKRCKENSYEPIL